MMNAKRLNYALILVLVGLIVGSIFTVVFATGWLRDKSQDLVNAKIEGETLELQETRAIESQGTLTKYADLRAVVNQIAPDEKEQDKVITELYKIASDNNIEILSVSFAASELDSPTNTRSSTPAPESDSNTNDPTEANATPDASTPSSSTPTQTERVPGLSGVVGLPINPGTLNAVDNEGNIISSLLTYDTVLSFLEDFERNRRQFLINSISITPTLEGGQIVGYSFDISLTALIAT